MQHSTYMAASRCDENTIKDKIMVWIQFNNVSDKILARWDLEYFLQCTICQNLWICINYNLRDEREEKMAYNTSLSFFFCKNEMDEGGLFADLNMVNGREMATTWKSFFISKCLRIKKNFYNLQFKNKITWLILFI